MILWPVILTRQKAGAAMTHYENLSAALLSMREGILIIDTEARIVFANQSYLDFVKRTADEILGRPLREIRPGARLPEVLATGQPILHAPRTEENDDIYFVNMYPVFLDGKVAGGLSVVTFLRDAYDFRTELEAYEKRNKQVLRRVNRTNSTRYTFDSIVAVEENARAVKSLAQRAAATDAAVLLASESGTGKELYAQAIHNASPRCREVFVAINCANFNANTLESELFGYVEGAFTGARRGGKIGLFEAANGGTIFLDEVSEMDMELQAKLLRLIETKSIKKLGSVKPQEVDFRLIATTNVDLVKCVEEKTFRSDLYYRLNILPFYLPPLRERKDDIRPLVNRFLKEFQEQYGIRRELSENVYQEMLKYDWPGNVRELRNFIERSVLMGSTTLEPRTAPPEPEKKVFSLGGAISEDEEKEAILAALAANGNHRERTARALNISRRTLQYKLKKYHIT